MAEALQFYEKALTCPSSDGDRASIWKNIAVTQFHMGKRLYSGLQWNVASEVRIKEIGYLLEQSLIGFSTCLGVAADTKNDHWKFQVQVKGEQCVDLIWRYFVEDPKHQSLENLAQLIGRLSRICWKTDGFIRGKLFLKLGHLSLQKAVQCQENGDHKKALCLLKDNYTAVEEAKQHLGLLEDVTDLEESTSIHLSIAESAMARERGELAWKSAIQDNEHLQMELVWDAVDHYNQAIILAREKCLESEAVAQSRLGELFQVLFVTDKSKEHYRAAVDLALTMTPRNFQRQNWYQKCLNGLQTYQDEQKWKEQKEQERIRAPIKEELKEVLDEFKAASAKSADHFLKLIYAKHPPKRGTKSNKKSLKVTILK
jgi:hypothetical protein